MSADSYTKVVLALILLCLVVLLANGMTGPSAGEGVAEAGQGARPPQYAIKVIPPQGRRGKSMLLRWETTTGRVWALKDMMDEAAYWVPLNREQPSGEDPPSGSPQEAAGAQGGEADGAPE